MHVGVMREHNYAADFTSLLENSSFDHSTLPHNLETRCLPNPSMEPDKSYVFNNDFDVRPDVNRFSNADDIIWDDNDIKPESVNTDNFAIKSDVCNNILVNGGYCLEETDMNPDIHKLLNPEGAFSDDCDITPDIKPDIITDFDGYNFDALDELLPVSFNKDFPSEQTECECSTRKQALKDSLENMEDNIPYQCLECHQKFVLHRQFVKHVNKHINGYQCSHCRMMYNVEQSINSVVSKTMKKYKKAEKIVKEKFKCGLCDLAFENCTILKNHLREHKSKLFTCVICSFSCKVAYSYMSHMNSHVTVFPFKCNVCQAFFGKDEEALERHMKANHGERLYCSLCDFTSFSQRTIYRHEKQSHSHRDLLFECDICDYTSDRTDYLKIHLKKHQVRKKPSEASKQDDKITYCCSKCKYFCDSKESLRYHFLHHNAKGKFRCDQCQFSSKYENGLKRHMMIHLGLKPYVCDVCQYSCRQAGALRCHKKYHHSTEKPLKCDICDMTFKVETALDNHKKTHNWREYSCKACSQTFTTNEQFKFHITEKHTELFQCNVCPSSFANSDDFVAHVKSHRRKGFKCVRCDYECGGGKELNMHMLRHSNKDCVLRHYEGRAVTYCPICPWVGVLPGAHFQQEHDGYQ